MYLFLPMTRGHFSNEKEMASQKGSTVHQNKYIYLYIKLC